MTPLIGMIVPPAAGEVPPEAAALHPEGRFIAEGLGLTRLTPEGYDSVIGEVEAAARRLAARGAEAVALMGTSLSFYRGAAFNRDLIARMEAASGVPCTTMSVSVAAALRALGARRVAVGAAYGERVNAPLRAFLEEEGFTVIRLEAMGIEDVEAIFRVTEAELLALGRAAAAAGGGADALFLSCGGLRTLSVTAPLEAETGLPVVSSAVAGVWGAMRLVGVGQAIPGAGRLLALA